MPAPLHPTLIIGYGTYGQSVMHRFLSTTSARGVLPWEEPSTGGQHGRINKLAMVVINSVTEDSSPAWESGLLEELHRQIQVLTAPQLDDLTKTINSSVSELLTLDRDTNQEVLRLGLDVFILLRPTGPAEMTKMMQDLQALLPLYQHPMLKATGEGARLLNLVLVLDVDGFSRAEQRSLHGAIRFTLQRAEDAYQRGGIGFARVYLVDADTPEGNRRKEDREDELSLLLEFILYEGHRDDPTLRRLIQRPSDIEPPILTFGFRVIERSSHLLSRLAAAAFGMEWMNYLCRESGVREAVPELDVLRAEGIIERVGIADLNQIMQERIEGMRTELLQLSHQHGWAHQILRVWERYSPKEMSSWAMMRRKHLREQRIGKLHLQLCEQIDRLLREHPSWTFKDVIVQLDRLIAELRSPIPIPPDLDRPGSGRFDAMEQDYRSFLHEQIRRESLSQWWNRLVGVLGCGAAPLVGAALEQIYGQGVIPGAVPGLLTMAGMAGAVYMTGARWADLQIERARAFYTHPVQGRLSALIRQECDEGGVLAAPLYRMSEQVCTELANNLRAQAARDLEQMKARLEQRCREAEWLRLRLLDFLKQNGIDQESRMMTVRSSSIRYSLDQERDVAELLNRQRLPCLDAFRQLQKDEPLTEWKQNYCNLFLNPLAFLDKHAKAYPVHRALQPDHLEQSRQIAASIGRFTRLHVGFKWGAEAQALVERFAIFPTAWHGDPEISHALRGIGIQDTAWRSSHNGERCYLLVIAGPVAPAALALEEV